ncbi:hypothetical protein AWH56_010715 [Anaerobacillus isosaccharinicus]|uniref:Uncharacterized protein n=1 Tax=Anaerobacillus isosaccharinicus TaxID=1532552 RepID=A0A7S7LBG3_9BACI|nr:hypothetical protein [Anaerobacillus isosaccharinicus]MBA5588599.1 hypothetical protein [Anaerobacillus isosaccharinicus]QOY37988.1 hypothetical protein AWH56_010715 [Anaerobacillus isosaccharinicus]
MSLYEKLPNDLLIAFYEEINKNINLGILSDAMYHELELLKEAADKNKVPLPYIKEEVS